MSEIPASKRKEVEFLVPVAIESEWLEYAGQEGARGWPQSVDALMARMFRRVKIECAEAIERDGRLGLRVRYL